MEENSNGCWDGSFFGSATVGERGQIVIPAEARLSLGIKAGDKLLVMKHPVHDGLMVAKIESIRGFLDEFGKRLTDMETMTEQDREQAG